MKRSLSLVLCVLFAVALLQAGGAAAGGDILLPEIPIGGGGGSQTAHLAGDINGDGFVNNKDLTRLAQKLAGRDVTFVDGSLDVNGDGYVNNKDLTRLAQKLAGRNVELFFGVRPAPASLAITAQPQSVTAQEGSMTQLTVTVTGGTPPYTYAWQDARGGSIRTVTSDAASDTLEVQAQTGYYPAGEAISCVVTDNAGSRVVSGSAVVTPQNPGGTPVVTVTVPGKLYADTPITLRVSGYGLEDLPYRFCWFIDPPGSIDLRTFPPDHEGLQFEYTPDTIGQHLIYVVMFDAKDDCWGDGGQYVYVNP